MDRPTDGWPNIPTDGRTDPYLEMRGRILKLIYFVKRDNMQQLQHTQQHKLIDLYDGKV